MKIHDSRKHLGGSDRGEVRINPDFGLILLALAALTGWFIRGFMDANLQLPLP